MGRSKVMVASSEKTEEVKKVREWEAVKEWEGVKEVSGSYRMVAGSEKIKVTALTVLILGSSVFNLE